MRRYLPLLITLGCATQPSTDSQTASKKQQTSLCAKPELFKEAHPQKSPQALTEAYLKRCGLQETIALTRDLVRFPTVRAQQSPADGEAFVGMAKYLQDWAQASGLAFETFGKNDAWELHLGDGDPFVTFVMHADVVPVDPKLWSSPPFEAKRKAGRLYGRGTEDDKGPIAAILVMMRAMKRFGMKPPGRITALMGTGEEHDWDGMIAYAKQKPHAKHTISLDAGYPVVIAESGFVNWHLSAPSLPSPTARATCATIIEAQGGQFSTQVPGEASVRFLPPKGVPPGGWATTLQSAVAAQKLPAHYQLKVLAKEKEVHLQVRGKAVHSSVAEEGHNALWALSAVASQLPLCPGGATQMIKLIAGKLRGDHYGEKLGLSYEHPVMGKLLVAPTILKANPKEVTLTINMRRPAGKSVDDFNKALDQTLLGLQKEFGAQLIERPKKGRYVGKPALVDKSAPLPQTLLQIYRERKGAPEAKPISIRGGTYARLFPGAVSFGPAIPGRPYRGHAPDEYVELEALQLMLDTTFQAVLRLK